MVDSPVQSDFFPDGFCIFEFDSSEETLVTFVYPSLTSNEKSVIQETGHFLFTSSNSTSMISSYESKFLYFDSKKSTDDSASVQIYGVCIFAPSFHPSLYLSLAKVLSAKMEECQSPPTILRDFFKAVTEGELSFKKLSFSSENEDQVSFDSLLDRAGQAIPLIWTALVTGKSVAFFSPDIQVLQNCYLPLLSFVKPGQRGILPFVMENSILQTSASSENHKAIVFSSDHSILNKKYDLIIDLSSRNFKVQNSDLKENSLAEQLMDVVNQATADENDVCEVIEEFNSQILKMLDQVKIKYGNLSSSSIQSLNVSSDKKVILNQIISSGVFEL